MQSYDAYEPCGTCRRHVKRQDAACPFCGAARKPEQPAATRRVRNASRAQWLAFGSTLLGIGCTAPVGSSGGSVGQDGSPDGFSAMTAPDASTSGPINEGGQDASAAVDVSTGNDDGPPEATDPWGGPDASCPRSGMFTCGSSQCDRATQFCEGTCSESTRCGGVIPGRCVPLSQLTTVEGFMEGGTCGSCPTCACIPPTNPSGMCSCFEDNYGGLTVACSNGGCYGSPPARLDRAALRAA
jgi:hypothetical protein